MKIKEKLKELNDRYIVWHSKCAPYDFPRMFYLMTIVYVFACAYDFCLTYLTYRITPAHFFEYEFSWLAKEVARNTNHWWAVLFVVLFMVPIIFAYVGHMIDKKKYGYTAGYSRLMLALLYAGAFMHMYGGFSNFVWLTSLNFS